MTLRVEFYTNFVCPWCLICERRLDNVVGRQFGNIAVDVEYHPVRLMPITLPAA